MTPASRHSAKHRDRGTILIVTMWIVLVLTGLAIMLAQSMGVEAVVSANESSMMQAQAVEQGAVQYVMSRLDLLAGDVPDDANAQCEAVRVGKGAFWIIRPDFDDDSAYAYGITDESSKLNLNTATQDMLLGLTDMTDELAACIVDWREPNEISSVVGGAKSDYYMLLSDPYQCKNGPLETVEELFLVKGATPEIIYGEDTNRNGVLDTNEDDGDASEPLDNHDGRLERGIWPFVTVYSREPNVPADANGGKLDVNDANSLQKLMDSLGLNTSRGGGRGRSGPPAGGIAPGTTFLNVLDFYVKSNLTSQQMESAAGQIVASSTAKRGLINVNTAPLEVLMCLPGLDETDVDAIMTYREENGVDLDNIAWVGHALGWDREKLRQFADKVTTRTCRFSADIVSVSGDGRAFRRCRIVVDNQKSPPKVIYRQDLTHLGWPLDPEIFSQLRSGVSLDKVAPMWNMGKEALK